MQRILALRCGTRSCPSAARWASYTARLCRERTFRHELAMGRASPRGRTGRPACAGRMLAARDLADVGSARAQSRRGGRRATGAGVKPGRDERWHRDWRAGCDGGRPLHRARPAPRVRIGAGSRHPRGQGMPDRPPGGGPTRLARRVHCIGGSMQPRREEVRAGAASAGGHRRRARLPSTRQDSKAHASLQAARSNVAPGGAYDCNLCIDSGF